MSVATTLFEEIQDQKGNRIGSCLTGGSGAGCSGVGTGGNSPDVREIGTEQGVVEEEWRSVFCPQVSSTQSATHFPRILRPARSK